MSKLSFSLKSQLEEAIRQDGGRAIFEHYGYHPSPRPQKENPFREERTSSFFIVEKFGKIIFKDFGDDEIKGDGRKFVRLYEKTDAATSFKILCQIYSLGDFSSTLSKTKRRKKKQAPRTRAKADFQKNLVEIKFRDFNPEELAFWQKKGNIDPETLKANKVQAVESFKIQVKPTQIKSYENLAFVFAYEILPQQSYKLYMPKSVYRVYAKSKTAFLPNLAAAREAIDVDYSYAFGLDTLEKNKELILCGGEPDCLALKSAGYNAFTLGNERADIPPYIQKRLKEEGFDLEDPQVKSSISVVYDTDYTGLRTSKKMADKLGFQRLILPKLKKQKDKEAPKPDANDICDYLQIYGWDADLSLTLNQQIFCNKDYKISQVPYFTVKKYLSEKKEILARFIKKYKRVQLDADAGIGKTFSLLSEIPQMLSTPILFAVPFAIQVEQIEKEYQGKVADLVCFQNKNRREGGDEEAQFFGIQPGKINVCTYDRARQVYKKLQAELQSDILVMVDESHLLTSEYAYRTQAIHDVLDICQQAHKIVYLSATPDYSLCQFSGFRLLKFRREKNPNIQIRAFDYKSSVKKSLLRVLQLLDARSKEGINVIRLNNKTLAKVMAQLLINQGYYKENEIDFVFSEKRKGKSTPSKDSIIHQSIIPSSVKLLFVTACFDCGINIQNKNIDHIISFETRYTDNCKDTLKQFIARFRNLDQIKVWICKPARASEANNFKSKSALFQRLCRDAQSKMALLPYNDPEFRQRLEHQMSDVVKFGLNTPRTPKYIKANRDISATHKLILKDKAKEEYQINYNYIRFILKECECKNMNNNKFYTDIIQELPQAALIQRSNIHLKAQDEQYQQLKNLLDKEKEARSERIQLICRLMKKDPSRFFDAVQAEYRDLSLRDKIKKHYTLSPASIAPRLLDMLNEEGDFKELDMLDGDIVSLSHRFFFLCDLLIPKGKIPALLEKYPDDVNFGIVSKTLVNHVNLRVFEKSQDKFNLLVPDYRHQEDIQWLQMLRQASLEWQPEEFQQKMTTTYKRQLESQEYDLKIMNYQRQNLFLQAFHLLENINQGCPLKSKYRSVKRKYKSLSRKMNRLEEKIKTLKNKLSKSCFRAFEIHDISQRMNQLKSQVSDWQGIRSNLRLLASLFHLRTFKRAIVDPQQNGKQPYLEKHFVELGPEKTFREVLNDLGFCRQESKEYLEHLDYQISLDIQNNTEVLSKFEQKSREALKHDNTCMLTSFDFLSKNEEAALHNQAYPSSWDI